ncbi:GNAT family N-acetyltransferase [Polyangium sorediatum]|uniref:GNAT family N-acetyltransferase n=1 Tax=Polyangium sorediatum TaxID=889274 RepID=A0ABT6NST2_9BACT|nr:GNAT family N-acetyltransferase [Polyangium sorediatum]MDI1431397.1 GNAT family N-acetyltransferase [Polyangium sorediatum]
MTSPAPPAPSSAFLEFRPPAEDDMPHLLALQTEASIMRYYGGVQDRANIARRLQLAMEHERRFGYGLWSLYERNTGEFFGIGGVIHYDFDFEAELVEPVVCLKLEAQGRGYGRRILELLHVWCRDAGLLHRAVCRVEIGNRRMLALMDSYKGHPSSPVVRCHSMADARYTFYRAGKEAPDTPADVP